MQWPSFWLPGGGRLFLSQALSSSWVPLDGGGGTASIQQRQHAVTPILLPATQQCTPVAAAACTCHPQRPPATLPAPGLPMPPSRPTPRPEVLSRQAGRAGVAGCAGAQGGPAGPGAIADTTPGLTGADSRARHSPASCRFWGQPSLHSMLFCHWCRQQHVFWSFTKVAAASQLMG